MPEILVSALIALLLVPLLFWLRQRRTNAIRGPRATKKPPSPAPRTQRAATVATPVESPIAARPETVGEAEAVGPDQDAAADDSDGQFLILKQDIREWEILSTTPVRTFTSRNAALSEFRVNEKWRAVHGNAKYEAEQYRIVEERQGSYFDMRGRELSDLSDSDINRAAAPDPVARAKEHFTRNRSEIEQSDYCICYICLTRMLPSEIEIWDPAPPRPKPGRAPWEYGTDASARCPTCGWSGVIGSAAQLPIMNESYLRQVQDWWHGSVEERGRAADTDSAR